MSRQVSRLRETTRRLLQTRLCQEKLMCVNDSRDLEVIYSLAFGHGYRDVP